MLEGNTTTDEEPRLSREIAKLALVALAILLAVGGAVALIIGLLWLHPIYGMIAWYGLLMVGVVVWMGYQNFRWKQKDFEWKKKHEAQEREWAEASERLRRSKL